MYQDFTFREFDVLTQQNSYLSAPAFAQTQFVASPDYNQMDGHFLLDIPIYHIDEVQDEFTGCCACSACGSEALKMAIIPGTDYVIDISAIDGSAGYQALMDFFAEMSGRNTSNQSGGVASMEGDTPGDATTTAVLQLDGSYTDELEVVGDRDWVAFTVTEAGRFEFNLFGSGTNELSDPYLYLRDSNGNLIAQNDDIQLGQILDSRIFATLDAGTYYLDVGAYNDSVAGEYTLTAVTAPPLRDYSIQEIAEYLREGSWTQRTHDDADQDASNGTTINYYIGDLPAGAQALAIAALEFWAEAANLDFNQVNTAAAADIDFINNEEGAFARSSVTGGTQITNVEINVASDWNGGNLDFNSYTLQTYIHEVGHALGLGHGGPYNGSANYNTDAIYLNDSWGTTVMSYFDQNESNFGTPRLVLGLQAADILAIQELYGQNTTTRTGDSVYGFNTTETGTIYDSQDWVNQGIRLPSFSIWDAGGTDTLDFSGYSANQRISLIAGTWSDVGDNTNTGDTTDPLFNLVSIAVGAVIENAIGGSGVDTITGNNVSNELTGNAGNDILDGGDGIDYAVYNVNSINDLTITDNGDGTFTVTANTGSDGTDTLSNIEFIKIGNQTFELGNMAPPEATSTDDDLDLTALDDTFSALGGNDTVRALAGNDVVNGNAGNDTLYGNEGEDRLFGSTGNDTLYGGADNDSLYGNEGNDRLEGEDGDDYMLGHEDDDVLLGGNGEDRMFGGVGDDELYGGADNDSLYGEAGNDRLEGEGGDDYLNALGGDDTLIGGIGNDRMFGGAGSDTIFGGTGDDTAYASSGNDTMYGNGGNDRLIGQIGDDYISGQDGNDVLSGGDGIDRLFGGDGNDGLYGGNDNDTLYGGIGNDRMGGDGGDDYLSGEAGNDYLAGGAGNDRVYGGDGIDRLFGGIGDDRLYAGNDDDQIYGDAGVDLLYGEAGNDYLSGGSGADILRGDVGLDRLYGGADNDQLFGGADNDTLFGGAGEDILNGDAGDDYLNGQSEDDILNGGAGIDRIFGDVGNDTLSGGADNDLLNGGDGNDIFVMDNGYDVDEIADFDDNGNDQIDVSQIAGFTDFASIQAVMTQVGSHVEIDFGNGDLLRLLNTALSDMGSDDFIYASAAMPLDVGKQVSLVMEPIAEPGSDPLTELLAQTDIALPDDHVFNTDDITAFAEDDGSVYL